MNEYEIEFEVSKPNGNVCTHGVGKVCAYTPDGAVAMFIKAMWLKINVLRVERAGEDWGHAQLIGGDFESGFSAQVQWDVTIETVKRRAYAMWTPAKS